MSCCVLQYLKAGVWIDSDLLLRKFAISWGPNEGSVVYDVPASKFLSATLFLVYFPKSKGIFSTG